ncbi:MAG: thioredoxin-disulfide reductase [Candidatus Omnitrophica bacterium]|nr:thioredoxin-disulfide reductase [Candidatus Omnitrophota bacterium]MBD3269127.1 thioredoxin-disulfide reductase [Candidatus Omnitrophota bacterium]
MNIYDLIILGAGPAGITAAVYSARKKMDFLIISKDLGGQAAWSGDIENYTGYQFISGTELVSKFRQHIEHFGVEYRMPEEAKMISRQENLIHLKTDKSEYISKSIIVATGKHPRPLGVKGEKEFKNRGVTYCATCDGPLFKGKEVVVAGGGNSAIDAALSMSRMSPKVYIVNLEPQLRGDNLTVETVKSLSNVEIINSSEITEIYGDKFVKGVKIKKDGEVIDLSVKGIFVEIGLIPNSSFIDMVGKNELGEIKVDCHNRTSVEGVFSAGDVTNVPEKQIIVACGEGSKASLSSFKYINSRKF